MFIDAERLLFALCLVILVTAACSAPLRAQISRAAVLRTGMPDEDTVLSEALCRELATAGYHVVEVDFERLCDPDSIDARKIDLLTLPDSSALPAKCARVVDSYLRSGGNLIALNTPMWQEALVSVDGRWTTVDEYQKLKAAEAPEHILVDYSSGNLSGWRRSCDTADSPTSFVIAPDGPAPGAACLRVTVPRLTLWDTLSPPDFENPFADGRTLTVFSAKGDAVTTQLAVEWVEKDGSRWIAVVALTEEWRQYALAPEDFRYWLSNPARGHGGDRFRPENARAISVGLALTHTTILPAGAYQYWLGPVGTARMSENGEEPPHRFSAPALDTLSPDYKFFDVTDGAEMLVRKDQTIVESIELMNPRAARSPHPRPRAGGFDKGRVWRWIPLLEARSANGEWRGNPAALLVHSDGPYKGGVWASFGIDDAAWYRTPEALRLFGQVACRMRDGVFMIDGGTRFYTHFDDQEITVGVRAFNSGDSTRSLRYRVTLQADDRQPRVFEWPAALPPGQEDTARACWKPDRWPGSGFRVVAEILDGERVIDRAVHEAHVWKPKSAKQFVTVQEGRFTLDGKPWRANGVNYMPSSGIGIEDGEYFEYWIGARSYDPEVIQRDLDNIKRLGFNSVSIFIYEQSTDAQNLLDILRRLEDLGIKANLSLRPGTPMEFLWPRISRIIKHYRLCENDTVFAYDLAWEPSFGTQADRKVWDNEWEQWVVERYGSVQNAEAQWGYPIPRDESGKITNPYPHEVDTDGEWRAMTAAYRRFLDTLLYTRYAKARRLVRSIDPNHLVSFRMSEAANPTYRSEGRITYDFPYLAAAVDFLAPEAYGRIGDWERLKPAHFVSAYGRWAAPNKPLVWAEAGVNTWDSARMRQSPTRLQFAAESYELFYRMLIHTAADGVFYWWYPGGFRCNENSDFGIINPDGTDKPVTKVIREWGPRYLASPPARPVDYWIEFDRDLHPDGVSGVYDRVKASFWAAIEDGRTPGLRTDGSGTNSATCPRIAVGNTPWSSTNPPKYLDAVFDSVMLRALDSGWEEVVKHGRVRQTLTQPLGLKVSITNLGEAALLAPNKTRRGGVNLVVSWNGQEERFPLTSDVPRMGSFTLTSVALDLTLLDRPVDVTLALEVDGGPRFGERFRFTVEPAQVRAGVIDNLGDQ